MIEKFRKFQQTKFHEHMMIFSFGLLQGICNMKFETLTLKNFMFGAIISIAFFVTVVLPKEPFKKDWLKLLLLYTLYTLICTIVLKLLQGD